ncbi:unnamed protein product [Prorocentrum cordatum]|uniref:H(+)-exporting diphosphatase n=1 Tax=Prorocentrum cordatum TaxID=2364126 RepID=A0ABN9TPL1_9DINO|nr:unnamed protein product [Polarella glacialis]
MNAFTGMTVGMMAWVLMLVELKAYSFLDRTTMLISIYCVTVLGASIIGLALLGGGVNAASDRIVFLLGKHAMELHSEAARRHDQGEDAGAPPGIAEFIQAVANDVAAEKQSSPVQLLGMYCGTTLITTLYVVPAFWFSRLGNMCADEPSLCTPEWSQM